MLLSYGKLAALCACGVSSAQRMSQSASIGLRSIIFSTPQHTEGRQGSLVAELSQYTYRNG